MICFFFCNLINDFHLVSLWGCFINKLCFWSLVKIIAYMIYPLLCFHSVWADVRLKLLKRSCVSVMVNKKTTERNTSGGLCPPHKGNRTRSALVHRDRGRLLESQTGEHQDKQRRTLWDWPETEKDWTRPSVESALILVEHGLWDTTTREILFVLR